VLSAETRRNITEQDGLHAHLLKLIVIQERLNIELVMKLPRKIVKKFSSLAIVLSHSHSLFNVVGFVVAILVVFHLIAR